MRLWSQFIVYLQCRIDDYELLPSKSCTRATINTIDRGACDGWPNTSLDNCKQYCTNNEMPHGCPKQPFLCKYAIWSDNPDWPPGWCHLANGSCILSDAAHSPDLQTWELRRGNNLVLIFTLEL